MSFVPKTIIMNCTLCNGTMKAGDGTAHFTSECSHSFHFRCITSYVASGNQICPICSSKWTNIPFQGLNLDPNFRVPKIDPIILPVQVNDPNPLPQRSFRSIRHQSFPQASEPSIFDDDDSLGSQVEFVSHSSSSIEVDDENNDNNINSDIRCINIKTYPEVSAVQRSVSQENFTILINLKAHVSREPSAQNFEPSRAPIDLVTVLDISGSMSGTKINLLKKAVGFVIQNLGPSDRLSVIAFSSTARRLFPLRRMTDSGRELALQNVNSLYAGGSTNILAGLQKGTKVIEDRREKNPVCSIILLSDGQDTYTDKGRLLQNVKLDTPVHAFGFGSDHDPVMLHSIAEASRGTFSFIESEAAIQDAFAQCIGGILSVVVQDLQVKIESIHPEIRLGAVKAGSYFTRVLNDNRTGFIDVGDLYADEERDFLVLVNVPQGGYDSNNEMKLINVCCAYKEPISKETKTSEGKEVKILRPEIVSEEWVGVSLEVDRQRNRLEATEAMMESRNAADRGDLSSARFILDGYQKKLADTASSRAGDQLCVALDAELSEMQDRMGNLNLYKSRGKAYMLSGMISHSRQRATSRGDSGDSASSSVRVYQTTSMDNMVSRSQGSKPTTSHPR